MSSPAVPYPPDGPIRVRGYTVTRAEWRQAEQDCAALGYVEPWVVELIAIGIHLRNRKPDPIKETS